MRGLLWFLVVFQLVLLGANAWLIGEPDGLGLAATIGFMVCNIVGISAGMLALRMRREWYL